MVDLGISKMNLPEGEQLTATGAILGATDYMAPERAVFVGVGLDVRWYSVGRAREGGHLHERHGVFARVSLREDRAHQR